MADKKDKKQKDQQIIPVSHTKGYYRFFKNYPSETDENRYRNNKASRQEPRENRSRLLLNFALILTFVFAFIATSVGLQLSNKEPATTTSPPIIDNKDNDEDIESPIFDNPEDENLETPYIDSLDDENLEFPSFDKSEDETLKPFDFDNPENDIF